MLTNSDKSFQNRKEIIDQKITLSTLFSKPKHDNNTLPLFNLVSFCALLPEGLEGAKLAPFSGASSNKDPELNLKEEKKLKR